MAGAFARRLFVSQLILIVALSILCVHKKVFVQPDGVSITLLEEDVGQANKTFTFSAIWSVRQGNGLWYRPSRRSICMCFCCCCVVIFKPVPVIHKSVSINL